MGEDASDTRRQPLLAGHSDSGINRVVDVSGGCVKHTATRARWWVLAQYSLLTFNQV